MASVYDLIPEFTLYKHCMVDEDRNFKMNVKYSIHSFSLMSNGKIHEVDDGKCILLVDNYEKYLIYKDGEAVHYNKQLCFKEFLSPHNIEEYTRLYACIDFNLLERGTSLSKEEKQKLLAYFSYVSLQFESWFQWRQLKLPIKLKTKLHNLLSDRPKQKENNPKQAIPKDKIHEQPKNELPKWEEGKSSFAMHCIYIQSKNENKNLRSIVFEEYAKYSFDHLNWNVHRAYDLARKK